MKTQLRLQLPPLEALDGHSRIPFALVDRRLNVLRTGELRLTELATILPRGGTVWAVLDPKDAVTADIAPPPVAKRLLTSTVRAQVQSMTLSHADQLVIAHGPRRSDGRLTAAWGQRQALSRACRTLAALGLKTSGLVPYALVAHNAPSEPSDEATNQGRTPIAWDQPWPQWSLMTAGLEPMSSGSAWRPVLRWVGAAAIIWALGLGLVAQQMDRRVQALHARMAEQFQSAFPTQPTPRDPVARARQIRDLQRQALGQSTDDEWWPLALSVAQGVPELAGQVIGLRYEQDQLQLMLRDGLTVSPAVQQALKALETQGFSIQQIPGPPPEWHVRRQASDTHVRRQP